MSNAKATNLPAGFEVGNAITLPLSKWAPDEPKYLKIIQPIYLGKTMSAKKGEADMEPAHLMRCVDLVSGEEVEVIAGAVLKSTLEESFPEAGYVTRAFMITQHKVEGKRYRTYSVRELVEKKATK